MWPSHQLPLCSGCRKHGNIAEASQNWLSFMQPSIILVVLSCCNSFARLNKPVIDVLIWILASCQWSILLSCCEMKLLHAQLSPSSQAHRDKTLTKTCQLWVCGKAFQAESECVFKVKNPGRPPTLKIVRRNFTEFRNLWLDRQMQLFPLATTSAEMLLYPCAHIPWTGTGYIFLCGS